MTITLGTLDTDDALHGTIEASAWDAARSVQTFFGLTGEVHLLGGLQGRNLQCWMLLHGHDTHALLQDEIESINDNINQSGEMIWVVDTDTKSFLNTIFLGFEATEPPWLDASGVNGWQVLGTLRFRQVKA